MNTSWWVSADLDAEGWAYVVYDAAGHPRYGTAATQIEAMSRARKLAQELEQADRRTAVAA